MLDKLVDTVLDELSGKRAWDWVARITQHHRIQGSPGYHDIASIMLEELERIGLDEVTLHSYPADGESKFWEWETPFSWKINSGTLNQIEPTQKVLARYDELPMNVVTHSRSCDVEAELVDIGAGDSKESYEGKELTGKIVLMHGSTRGDMPSLLKQSGAIGCIIYPSAQRAGGYMDMVRYDGFWPTSETFEDVQFGFSINHRQGIELQKMLEKGTVKLHAKIDAELYRGTLETLTGCIRGTEFPEEEILLMAHLCHPAASANDNASGSAGLLEIARSYSALIAKGRVDPPKRTIRFIWMPEFHGTVPYAKENEERWKNAVAAINFDMIGEHPVSIGFPFQVFRAPYSTPSPLNDIIEHFTSIIADHPAGVSVQGSKMPMRYRFTPFAGGSDHLISADSFFGVPSVMFGHNDHYHHTSLDVLDKVDPTEMQRIMGIGLCTSHILACMNEDTLENIWGIVQKGMYSRLGRSLYLVENIVHDLRRKQTDILPLEKIIFAHSIIEKAAQYEQQILQGLSAYMTKSKIIDLKIEQSISELRAWVHQQKLMFDELRELLGIGTDDIIAHCDIYQRNFDGPLSFSVMSALQDEEAFKAFMARDTGYGGIFFELMNLVGKSLDICSISALLGLQYNCTIYPAEIRPLLDILEKNKIIESLE